MGKKEPKSQAANLILVDDDFSKWLRAIAMGRRIYKVKKATNT
jgi:hypothetical protein